MVKPTKLGRRALSRIRGSGALACPRVITNPQRQSELHRTRQMHYQMTLVIGLQLLIFATAAHGQVRGVYAPGATLFGGGTVPDPGLSISDQYWINTADELDGPLGQALPIQGAVTVSSNTITVEYVPRAMLLGAHVDFAVGLATTNNSFVLVDPLPGSSNHAGAGRGLTN